MTNTTLTAEGWDRAEDAHNGPVWIGTFLEDATPDDGDADVVMIAPANDLPGDVYGVYYGSNPAYVISRALVPYVLADIPDRVNARLWPHVTSEHASPMYLTHLRSL